MSHRYTAEEAAALLFDDESQEDLDESDYHHYSDFEDESTTESESEESESESGNSVATPVCTDRPNARPSTSDTTTSNVDLQPRGVVRGGRGNGGEPVRGGGAVKGGGRGRGRQRGVVQRNDQWVRDTRGFTELPFQPNEQPGPKDMPPNIGPHSEPLDFFSLFWDDALWQLLVTETNNQAARVKAAKPNNYIAKNWVDVNLALMKAFMGCRVTMEMLIHKDRYEPY